MVFPEVAPENTDAAVYLLLGRRCATTGACWDATRPVGTAIYFSLPYRLGLPPETIVVLNWALLAISVTLAARLLAELTPSRIPGRTVWCVALAAVSHLAFMGAPACNALSDVPAACLLLIALELAALGWRSGSRRHLVLAGLSLGLAAFVRAYYLYPVLLGGLAAILGGALRRRASRALWVVAPALLPIAAQVTVTFLNTTKVAFIDRAATQRWRSLHLQSPLSGYDTLVPASALPYAPPAADPLHGGLESCLRSGDLGGVVRLVDRRLGFYFGTWVPFGGVYLRTPGDRIFSRWILALQLLALALAVLWLSRIPVRDGLELPIVVLGAVVAEGLAIVPESRFVMAFQVVLWMAALACLGDLVGRALHKRRGRRIAQP